MKHTLGILLILCCALGLTVGAAAQGEVLPRFEPGACTFAVPAGAGADVECGTVTVPEDRANPDPNDVVQLAVAIYRAEGDATGDPVFFLQGGPGGGIVETIVSSYASIIAPITASRDFVVFDQRGTGLSTPALNCPQVTRLLLDNLREDYTPEQVNQLYLEAIATCRDDLNGQGINLAAYTSPATAADIIDMADVLGYDTISLYGASYGTRLAQTVMRDFPARVSSAILDGVLSIADNQIAITASKADWALTTLFAACEADAACAAAYPGLEDEFYALLARLDAEPAPVSVILPNTSETITTTIDSVDMIGAVFLGLQQSSLIGGTPATIQAVVNGDTSPLASFLTLPVLIGDGINYGAFLSVICSEEAFATTAEALDAEAAAYPLLATFINSVYFGSGSAFISACQSWGAAPFAAIEGEALTSELPTLLLSGQFDPATPPYLADGLAANLTTTYNYVLPGAGHVASLRNACAASIIIDFLADPATAPDSSCLAGESVAFITPATEIALVPVTNETFGYTSVIPEGWVEVSPGTYASGPTGTVALLQQAIPAPIDAVKALLGGQLGINPFPDVIETLTADGGSGLEWQRYDVAFAGQSGALALAEADGTTYLLLLIASSADRALYYDKVFLPALNALTPN